MRPSASAAPRRGASTCHKDADATMLAALLVCAAHALAPVPDRAADQVASAGPVASADPLARLQQNLADLEERTASARAELMALQAQPGGGAA